MSSKREGNLRKQKHWKDQQQQLFLGEKMLQISKLTFKFRSFQSYLQESCYRTKSVEIGSRI